MDSDNTSFIITTIYTPSRKKLGGNVVCVILAVYRYSILVLGYYLHIFSIKKGLVLFGLALAVFSFLRFSLHPLNDFFVMFVNYIYYSFIFF